MPFINLPFRAFLASVACIDAVVNVQRNSLLGDGKDDPIPKSSLESYREVKQIMPLDYDDGIGWPPHDMKWPRGDFSWPFLGPAINKTSVVTQTPTINKYPQTSVQPPVTIMAHTVRHNSFTEKLLPIESPTTSRLPVITTPSTQRYWTISGQREKSTQLPVTTSRPKKHDISYSSSWLFHSNERERERDKFNELLSKELEKPYQWPYHSHEKKEKSQSLNDLLNERDTYYNRQPFFRKDIDKLLQNHYKEKNHFKNNYPNTRLSNAYDPKEDSYYAMDSYSTQYYGNSYQHGTSLPFLAYAGCLEDRNKSVLPIISIVSIWLLYLIFFIYVYTNSSSSGRKMKRSFWNVRAKHDLEGGTIILFRMLR